MKTLLHIDSSAQSAHSVSRNLSARVVEHWTSNNPLYRVTRRDLAREPLPHFDATMADAYFTPPDQRNAEQNDVIAESDQLIGELEAADVIVIGVPMYNFGIPSTLKAWIDHVARAGRTFQYTEQGPQGLLRGKKAIVASARGGRYTGSPLDHQEPYLKTVLNFLGIEDISFIRAEGLAMGDEDARADVLKNAQASILQLAAV